MIGADGWIQLGDWRIGSVSPADRSTFSFSHIQSSTPMVFTADGEMLTNPLDKACEHDHDYEWLKWTGVGLFGLGFIFLFVALLCFYCSRHSSGQADYITVKKTECTETESHSPSVPVLLICGLVSILAGIGCILTWFFINDHAFYEDSAEYQWVKFVGLTILIIGLGMLVHAVILVLGWELVYGGLAVIAIALIWIGAGGLLFWYLEYQPHSCGSGMLPCLM